MNIPTNRPTDAGGGLGSIPRPKEVRRLPGAARGSLHLQAGPDCMEAAAVYAECAAELGLDGAGAGVAGAEGAGAEGRRIPVSLVLGAPPPPAGGRGAEAYRLQVADDGIEVRAASHAGLVYGIHTLLQLARRQGEEVEVPACVIDDWPDFRMRGLQDDPARGQVATVAGYERLIRELSRLKYNVLTFHTEDLFAFERYPALGRAHGAMDASRWRRLVEYGRRYGVELFLTFQTFGHAGRVTGMPEFNHLSDLDGGASHYSPAVPAVYDFLGDLLDELAAVFDGDTIHVGCDEVALSGRGLRSSAMVRERGAAAVYVDHVREVARLARRHWRRVLFFAEFADTRYRPHAQGADDDVRALRDAGLSFVNWNYYDDKPEEYFPFLHRLQRHGVDQVISPGVWTWRQLFPSFTLTRETLPVFTQVGFGEGITDSITCAWNDTRDCFRELHYLNYAFAAEHQWNGAAPVEAAEPFIARWAERFFGAPADALARAHAWLGDLNAKAFAAGRHDHRYPRDFNWRPMAAHAVFWNYPVPGAGSAQDAAASERLAGEARELEGEVNAAAAALPRNRPVADLVAYELRRAAWLFDSVRFGAAPDTAAASRLARELRRLGRDFVPLWDATNIPQGREGVEERFAKLAGLYEQEARALTPWDGGWGPARRMQTGPHPM